MNLKNLKLTPATVNPALNPTEFLLSDVSTNRVYNTDGSLSRDVDSYSLHCVAHRNDVLKVKVPSTLAEKVTKLHDDLNADNDIVITFDKLKLTAFSMITKDGKMISGVSGKAENFSYQIVSNIVEL